ncbi:MFS transporter [uncultured Celeribacter sp.]|uniref:MFS transporter n=1 Tax=uncultured Celeribacter sp. TaxID=1303376 RepID=UPI002AA760B4|nr:MFS transporter [uncultured Celeribacter sp.]
MTDISPTSSHIHAPTRTTCMILSICLAAMVLPLTFAGGAIATPDLGRSFGQTGPLLSWVVNAFMLVFGALPLVAGTLADRIGRRKVFRVGLVGFVLSGLLLIVAPSLLLIDILRGTQGLFAAATLAGGTTVLAQLKDETQRRRAFSLIGATFGVGLAFGPVMAGAVLEVAGWRAVFGLASGLAFLALILGLGALPESRTPAAGRFDWLGAGLFATALIAITVWAILLPTRRATDPVELALLVATVLIGAGFVWRELRCEAPMFDLGLLRAPAFLGVQILPIATCFCFVSLLVVVPLQLIGAGYSEFSAGLICLALSVPVFVISLLFARTPVRNRRRMIRIGLGIAALGLTGLAVSPLSGPLIPVLVSLGLVGVGTALPWGLMDGLAVEVVPREKAGVATGMFSTVRVASEGVVLALVSALQARLIVGVGGLTEADAMSLVAGGPLEDTMQAPVAEASRVLFLLLAGLTVLVSLSIPKTLSLLDKPRV